MAERQTMKLGGRYNWRNQPERLVYIGRNWSGNGYWHQFEKVGEPGVVWCEVLDSDLPMIEETQADSGGKEDRRGLWRPIETAPRDREVLFWIRPKTADETWSDSSGKPILTKGEPHSKRCEFKCWPSLWTATHWMEPWEPSPPGVPVTQNDSPKGGA